MLVDVLVSVAQIGSAERALEAMIRRVTSRQAFGRPLAEQGTIRSDIALSRVEIDQVVPCLCALTKYAVTLIWTAAVIPGTVGDNSPS